MAAVPADGPGLKRSLSVWAAVGLSVALMAPSMAANINPQASATTAGRAVPLTFPVGSAAWLAVAVLAVIFAPGTARRLGLALAAREGIAAPGAETPGAHRKRRIAARPVD